MTYRSLAPIKVTVPSLPAVHLPKSIRVIKQVKEGALADPWFLLLLITAMIASVLSWKYTFERHWTLLYADAHSHMEIARRVLDNSPPGLSQLGGVWLPLPHILMFPFIGIDYFWETGLAGSIPSMICFVVTAIYIFLIINKLTQDSVISYIGSLVFIFNLNVLYLQSTPLTEPILEMTITITLYYVLIWAQSGQLSDLIKASIASFFLTLSRYEGWPIFLAIIAVIILVGIFKRSPIAKISSDIVIFGWLGGFAIGLWLLWNMIIFHDILYFQRSKYSAQYSELPFIQHGLDRMYHNVFFSIHDYIVLIITTSGFVLFGLSALGLILFFFQNRSWSEITAISLSLILCPFYILTFYTGQEIIYAPGAFPNGAFNHWFNDRYGISIIIPLSIFFAIFIYHIKFHLIKKKTIYRRYLFNTLLFISIIVIIFQSVWMYRSGIITLQDGQFGASCFHFSTITQYLTDHYNGGLILDDPSYDTTIDFAEAHIDLRNVIYQGSGKLWSDALSSPKRVVEWLIIDQGDDVSKYIDVENASFNSTYQLLVTDPTTGSKLFYLRGKPPLPSRNSDVGIYHNYYALCGTAH